MKNKAEPRSLDSHQRIAIAFILGVISFFLFYSFYQIEIAIVGAWDILALTDIVLAWLTITKKNAKETVQNAKLQDTGRSTILFFIIATALISLVAITILLKTAKHSTLYSFDLILAFAFVTVAISWILVHTVFTIHYAHVFYAEGNETHIGGLEFPKEKNPYFIDFAYYSFNIGMTFQVSDVQVSSRRMRKLTLAHSLVSFLFNTFIVAFTINIIAGLL